LKKPSIEFSHFEQLDIRTGTVMSAEDFPQARKPSLRLKIDFGDEIGVLQSSAQITELYEPRNLIGRQILAVVNFLPKRIAGFESQCLVLGLYTDSGVVLIQPDSAVSDGSILG
jgi:tRNA-binding protein